MSLQGYWSDLAAPIFRDLPDDLVVVLPIGATEQHGPHLPLSVDTDLTEAAIARMLAALSPDQNVLVLPTLSITKSNEHSRHPGTLSLGAETFLAVLRDIGASVARAGVARLVLFNGHGGNTAMLHVAARELRIAHDMIVATTGWSAFADAQRLFEPVAYAQDLHAGDVETSAMLAARPDRVDMGQAQDFRPRFRDWPEGMVGFAGQAAVPGWIIDDLNPDGACGNAANATADKGDAMLAAAGQNFATFLAAFASFDHRAGPGAAT